MKKLIDILELKRKCDHVKILHPKNDDIDSNFQI